MPAVHGCLWPPCFFSPPSLHTVGIHPACDLALTLSEVSLLLGNAILHDLCVYLLWLLFIDVWLFLLLGLIVLGGLSVRTRMVDHFGPRCSFLMSIYDSSSPVLFLNLGHWMWDPLAWVSPPTTHTFTFQAIESVSYFSFHSLRKSFTFNLLNRSRQFLKVHLYVISFFFLRLRIGAGESAQWSGVLTAPEEGLSSVSNTCAHRCLCMYN